MDQVHYWTEWVFTDYCHFTKEANKKIAHEIGKHIISNGKYEVFKHKKESVQKIN